MGVGGCWVYRQRVDGGVKMRRYQRKSLGEHLSIRESGEYGHYGQRRRCFVCWNGVTTAPG